ncbi:hypothetical protein J6590_012874 [Homalodisca vitripennis]|nr:hypothetical protein J6590_012874 [Homalodisca vitripennis]
MACDAAYAYRRVTKVEENNNYLKQKVHESNSVKIVYLSELEDKLRAKEDEASKLTYLKCQQEIEFLKQKLELEQTQKNNLVQQSDKEKNQLQLSIDKLTSLISTLQNKTQQLKP